MRVAFCTNFVSPYRRPLFQKLADTPDWDFRVFVNATSEFDRAWDVDCGQLGVTKLETWSIKRTVHSEKPVPFEQVITLHLPLNLGSELRKYRPDVVFSHELGPRSLAAYAASRRLKRPFVLWSYQSRISASQGSYRSWLRRFLLRRADAIVGMGTQARDVLRSYGAADENVFDAFNAPDTDRIAADLADPGFMERLLQLRQRLPTDRKIALVTGRLVPLKGIEPLVAAWTALTPEERSGWCLAFVGDGPLKTLVEGREAEGIHALGVAPPEDMTAWHAVADLHVFASCGDVWGLVVNEAMAVGAPVLCSVHAGCHDDLIDHGRNGLLWDPMDPQSAKTSLAAALRRDDLPELGQAGLETISPIDQDQQAEAFRQAVSHGYERFLRRTQVLPSRKQGGGPTSTEMGDARSRPVETKT
ncbi:MAG: glycosyltransferase family 4 protein [Acidobacteriota bacterium]